MRSGWLLAILAIFLLVEGSALAQQKLLTIDTIYGPGSAVNFSGAPANGLRWLKDGRHFLQFLPPSGSGRSQLCKVDAVSGQAVPLYDAALMQSAFEKLPGLAAGAADGISHRDEYTLSADETAVVVNFGNDLFYYQFGSATARRLTSNPEPEEGEEFSPDGALVSFVRSNNIFVIDLKSGRERALTTDGGENVLNGRLDWIYQEEVYGRGHFDGYWWSPDSSRIAYLRLDESRVPRFAVVDDAEPEQKVTFSPYPKAGDPNPVATLGIVDISTGKTTWVDVPNELAGGRGDRPAQASAQHPPDSHLAGAGSGPVDGEPPGMPPAAQIAASNELLFVRVTWTPDSRSVAYQVQNREQTWLDLDFADCASGKSRPLIHESSKTWVDVLDDPSWLKDGSFLWLSERSGWTHIYHYSRDGALIGQVTGGDWEVRSIDGTDPGSGTIFFSATKGNPVGTDLYSIHVDGSGLVQLTQNGGAHTPKVSPRAEFYFDYWSNIDTPPQIRLFRGSGELVRVIDANPVPALAEYKLGRVQMMEVKARDGFPMEAELIKPPDFDPSRKYPVLTYIYGGPHLQLVRDAWGGSGYMWLQMMAERGYLIWICDNRTASGKGAVSTWPLFHEFGDIELRDLEDSISWLKSQPYVDGTRIGIWGWSFGGFMTSYALTHSKTFKMGIAGGTVSDWHYYDSIYTERYMGLPERNPEGYARSSVVAAAANLHGKLMLIHGSMDDNVHIQNTIQLIYALENAGRAFDIMLYPRSRHGVTDPNLVRHLRQTMTDYILKNL